jgi:hypothetical protein
MSYFIEIIEADRPSIVVVAQTLDHVRMAPRPGEGEPAKLNWQADGLGKWRCLVKASIGTETGFEPVEVLFTARVVPESRLVTP